MKYERIIRALPTILLVVAAVDFIRQVFLFLSLRHADNVIAASNGPSDDLTWQVFFGAIERILSAIIYPLGWVTSAAILSVLLAIYDRGQPDA